MQSVALHLVGLTSLGFSGSLPTNSTSAFTKLARSILSSELTRRTSAKSGSLGSSLSVSKPQSERQLTSVTTLSTTSTQHLKGWQGQLSQSCGRCGRNSPSRLLYMMWARSTWSAMVFSSLPKLINHQRNYRKLRCKILISTCLRVNSGLISKLSEERVTLASGSIGSSLILNRAFLSKLALFCHCYSTMDVCHYFHASAMLLPSKFTLILQRKRKVNSIWMTAKLLITRTRWAPISHLSMAMQVSLCKSGQVTGTKFQRLRRSPRFRCSAWLKSQHRSPAKEKISNSPTMAHLSQPTLQ